MPPRLPSAPRGRHPLFELASAYDMLDREAEAELAYGEVRRLGIDQLLAEASIAFPRALHGMKWVAGGLDNK
jgi:hypothetical protein